MSGGKKARGCEATVDDQEWYIRENAVAIVRARDAQIGRLRERITKLEHSIRALRLELKRRADGNER